MANPKRERMGQGFRRPLFGKPTNGLNRILVARPLLPAGGTSVKMLDDPILLTAQQLLVKKRAEQGFNVLMRFCRDRSHSSFSLKRCDKRSRARCKRLLIVPKGSSVIAAMSSYD